MQARLKSPVQTDATLLANIPQHCWELLRPFACHVAKSLTGFKFPQQLPTTRNNMQQDVQADATCNIQQCWELLANSVASVCKELNMQQKPCDGLI